MILVAYILVMFCVSSVGIYRIVREGIDAPLWAIFWAIGGPIWPIIVPLSGAAWLAEKHRNDR